MTADEKQAKAAGITVQEYLDIMEWNRQEHMKTLIEEFVNEEDT